MAKYSKAAQNKVASAMKSMENETLKSGRSNKKVTDPKQAIAIGLSEARKNGTKVPVKKATVKKAAQKKVAATKTFVKKSTQKKAPPKKPAVKKAPPKQLVASKPVNKVAARKTVLNKSTAKKTPGKKLTLKEQLPIEKTTIKKQPIATPVAKETDDRIANTENLKKEQQGLHDGLLPQVNNEDPITAVDKHFFAKATTKQDPNHKMQLSSSKKFVHLNGKKAGRHK